jgi:hypothetical protein
VVGLKAGKLKAVIKCCLVAAGKALTADKLVKSQVSSGKRPREYAGVANANVTVFRISFAGMAQHCV